MKIIKFGATWCSPCCAFAPKFENVSKMEEFKDIEFISMDIESDDAVELVEKFQIRSVPTIVLVKDDGEISKKVMGNIPENEFISIINNEIKVNVN